MHYVYDKIGKANAMDWMNRIGCYQYEKPSEARITFHGNSLTFTDLRNALRRGKTCPSYRIEPEGHNFIFQADSLENAREILEALPLADGKTGIITIGGKKYEVWRNERDSNRVFSHLHVDRIKPLDKAPKKWTVPHAVRAIVNGQYDSLECTGRYSDDYAYDAAVNFGKGQIASNLGFAARIIDSPSGWRAYERDGIVTISCYHFDNNSFKFNVNKQNPPKESAA